MIYRPNGFRYKELYHHENAKHIGYNYERYGLLNKILPKYITSTQNEFTRATLEYIEYQLVWLMRYVDKLKNFKAYESCY